jgi:hypothetical protein
MMISKRQLKNEALKLDGQFLETLYPIQANGKINDQRFYFRMRDGYWSFSVADDNSNVSEPAAISTEDQGFILRGSWDDVVEGQFIFDRAEEIIQDCAKQYVENTKTALRKYQDRIVAFIDIIGFKSIVEKTVHDVAYFNRIIDAIAEIRDEFVKHPNSEFQKCVRDRLYDPFIGPDYKTKVIQVSDSMVISKLATVHGAVEDLVLDAALAIHILITQGLLCRGCIEYGKVYHTDEYIIGPGYTAAYLGEEKEFLPAISLGKEVYSLALDKRSSDARAREYFDKFVVPHTSDRFFIDYFNDLKFIDVFEEPAEHYDKLKNIIQDEYREAKDYKLKAKYLWMIDRFNESTIVRNGLVKPIRK